MAVQSTLVAEALEPNATLIGLLVDGRYEVTELARRSATFDVYLAGHRVLRRHFALKVLRAPSAEMPAVEAFKEEIRVLAVLEHAHLVQVVDSGELSGGEPYAVCESLEGETLGQHLRRRGPCSPCSAVQLMLGPVSALAELHARDHQLGEVSLEDLFVSTKPGGGLCVRWTGLGWCSGSVLAPPAHSPSEDVRRVARLLRQMVWGDETDLLEAARGLSSEHRALAGVLGAATAADGMPHAGLLVAELAALRDAWLARGGERPAEGVNGVPRPAVAELRGLPPAPEAGRRWVPWALVGFGLVLGATVLLDHLWLQQGFFARCWSRLSEL